MRGEGDPVIRFPLGRVVATPGALSALEKAEQLPAEFLDRHVNGDWGEVPDAIKEHIREMAQRAIESGGQVKRREQWMKAELAFM